MLKEHEAELSGRVRFMFQSAEGTFEGAKDMLANGILEGVDQPWPTMLALAGYRWVCLRTTAAER